MLAVDLDGTLLRSDMLYETFWSAVARHGSVLYRVPAALMRGRAALKRMLSDAAAVDPAALPYDGRVISLIEDWRENGGRTALVTASDRPVAEAIAKHLGLFDEVHASDGATNLKGAEKARFLADAYGKAGHVYVGDSSADLPVWAGASAAISVNAAARTRAALERTGTPARHLPLPQGRRAALLRALRPHQWLKNVLVFVPFLADPGRGADDLLALMAAFFALSLAASAGYVLNDLLDLTDDRSHPRKRTRPFASGTLSAETGTWMVPGLLLLSLGIAGIVSGVLAAAVAVYFIATTAYSVKLKRHSIVDICMLAFLFTLRIIAGGVAIEVPLSVWLLAFSMFVFFSLAAVKRLAELSDAETVDRPVSRRGYRAEDKPVLSQMAIAAGYLGVLVLALYIDILDDQGRFGAAWLLWGVCPLLLFWISRMVLVAGRGDMHDDPLVWTLLNRTSRLVVLFTAVLLAAAVLS